MQDKGVRKMKIEIQSKFEIGDKIDLNFVGVCTVLDIEVREFINKYEIYYLIERRDRSRYWMDEHVIIKDRRDSNETV
jgi:hypothetical protein